MKTRIISSFAAAFIISNVVVFAFVLAAFVSAPVATAQTRVITPLAQVQASATLREEAGKYVLTARIRELSVQTAGTLTAKLRYQLASGAILGEQELGVLDFSSLRKEATVQTVISPNELPNVGEPVEVFVIVTNDSGIQLAAIAAGTIEPNEKPKHFSELKGCEVTPVDGGAAFQATCTLADVVSGDVLVAELLPTDAKEPIAIERVTLQKGQKQAKITVTPDQPGHYQLRLQLWSADAQPYPGVIIRNIIKEGDWIALLYFSGVRFQDGTYEAEMLFDGSPETKRARGLYWWILDEVDTVCAEGHLDLTTIVPYQRRLAGTLPETCTNPRFVAVLYHGFDADGNPKVIKQIGEADFATLLAQTQKKTQLLNGLATPEQIFLLIVLIALLYALWRILVHKSSPLSVLLVAVSITTAAAVVEAGSSFIFTTEDNPNVVLTVTLMQETYKPGGDLLLAVSLDDRRAVKTERPAISLVVPTNGKRIEVFSKTEANQSDVLSKAVTLPAGAPQQKGTYNAQILVPDLCGSAFDYSKYQEARFGKEDCAFEFTFKVDDRAGDGDCTKDGTCPPTDPTIQAVGQCVPGETQTFRFISHYRPDGKTNGKIAFAIEWSDGEKNRIPPTGFQEAGVWREMQKSWSSDVINYTLWVQAVAENGTRSGRVPLSGTCGDVGAQCGNGILERSLGEECDDGNTVSGDGCSSTCELEDSDNPFCGNGVVEPQYGEECDPPTTDGQCTLACRLLDTCIEGMEISSVQPFVRPGGSVRLSWSVPQEVRRCWLYANGKELMNNAHLVTYYLAENIKGETTFTLQCDSLCAGDMIATSTTIYLAPGWREQ